MVAGAKAENLLPLKKHRGAAAGPGAGLASKVVTEQKV